MKDPALTMDSTVKTRLRNIILSTGTLISQNPRLCDAYLSDLMPDYPKERRLLTQAVAEGIPAQLLFHAGKQQQKLKTHFMIAANVSEEEAEEVVATWRYALHDQFKAQSKNNSRHHRRGYLGGVMSTVVILSISSAIAFYQRPLSNYEADIPLAIPQSPATAIMPETALDPLINSEIQQQIISAIPVIKPAIVETRPEELISDTSSHRDKPEATGEEAPLAIQAGKTTDKTTSNITKIINDQSRQNKAIKQTKDKNEDKNKMARKSQEPLQTKQTSLAAIPSNSQEVKKKNLPKTQKSHQKPVVKKTAVKEVAKTPPQKPKAYQKQRPQQHASITKPVAPPAAPARRLKAQSQRAIARTSPPNKHKQAQVLIRQAFWESVNYGKEMLQLSKHQANQQVVQKLFNLTREAYYQKQLQQLAIHTQNFQKKLAHLSKRYTNQIHHLCQLPKPAIQQALKQVNPSTHGNKDPKVIAYQLLRSHTHHCSQHKKPPEQAIAQTLKQRYAILFKAQ